jgi:HPt (histidine-containing phosphotransfer) domain-containing protein
MDCQMPEIDGFEATRVLRSREGDGRRTPIVAMTANAMEGDRERCLEAGMDGYLTKPVRPDDLSTAISRWLPLVESDDPPHAAIAIEAQPVAPTPDFEMALLDLAQLGELRAIAGTDDEAFMTDLIGVFLAEGEREVSQVRAAVGLDDPGAVMQAAHRLKGSALNLGCASLAHAAEALEILGRNGDLEGAGPLVERLSGAFDRTEAALRIELEAA